MEMDMSLRILESRLSDIELPEVDEVLQASAFSKQTPNPLSAEEIVALHSGRFHKGLGRRLSRCSAFPSPGFVRRQKRQRTTLYTATAASLVQESMSHINSLPDDILQSIVSRLQMKERAATSVLSRRWRNVWPWSSSVLNLDLTNKIGHDYLLDENVRNFLMIDPTFIPEETRRFTGWLAQMLQVHLAPPKIDALRISFPLDKESASYIDPWIACAANKGLTDLELDFDLVFLGSSSRRSYEFPFRFFTSSLNYLRLKCACFNFPPDFKVFNSLKSLTLTHCYLNEDGVPNILSNCSSLECFTLLDCGINTTSNKLEFSGPSLRLKHLCILQCLMYLKDIKIELHHVGIISFDYINPSRTTLSIKNAPHLSRLVLCTKTPVDILGDVPPVKTIFMPTWTTVKESILPNSQVFNNVKRLVLMVTSKPANLIQIICILDTCHSLQKLELDMGLSPMEQNMYLKEIASRPGRPYKNLKETEIYGFQYHLEKIEFLKCLLGNAVVLEKMKISWTSRKYLGNGEWSIYEPLANETRPSLEIWNMLQGVVSSSTTITVE